MERPSRRYMSAFMKKLKELAGTAADVLTNDLIKNAMKYARSHAGGKASGEKRAIKKLANEPMPKAMAERVHFERRFIAQDPTDDEITESLAQTGLMIAFYPDENVAMQLAVPDGEAPEELHLTLAFLGDYRQYGAMAKAHILAVIEDLARWSAPLAGEISGIGRFIGDDGVDVFYASVDCPGLNEFRSDLVRRLANVGCPVQSEHGFDPHITLQYIPADSITPNFNPAGIALRFEAMCAVFGDEEVEMRFTGMAAPGVAGLYHEVADLCTDAIENGEPKTGLMHLFMEQPGNFAEPPEWINYLPKPGVYTHPEYGQMGFTLERNQRFVDNFSQNVYQEKLPIDCEHDLPQSGAVGWITMMRVNEDGSVDARSEWNDRGVELIEDDRFLYFSPAWYNVWTDPVSTDKIKDVAIGGAICTRPFFKEKALRPLVSSESGLRLGSSAIHEGDAVADTFFTNLTPVPASTSNANEGVNMKKFDKANPPTTLAEALQLLVSMSEELTAAETARTASAKDPDGDGDDDTTAKGDADNSHFDKDGKKKPGMFDADGKPLAKKAGEMFTAVLGLCDKQNPPKTFAEAVTSIGTRLEATGQTNQQQAAEVVKLTERLVALENDKLETRLVTVASEFVGDREGHLSTLRVLYKASDKGEEGDAFKSYVTSQKAHAEQLKASGLFKELGAGTGATGGASTPMGQLETKAKEIQASERGKDKTYEQCFALACTENAGLYQQHTAAMRSGRATSAE